MERSRSSGGVPGSLSRTTDDIIYIRWLRLFRLPLYQLVELLESGLNDPLVQPLGQFLDRGVTDRLKQPFTIFPPQGLKCRKGLLALLNDGHERDHVFGHQGLEFLGHGFGLGDVGDDKAGQTSKYVDCLRKVFRFWSFEVEDHWQEAALAEFVPQPLQNGAPVVGEPSQQEHALLPDSVDNLADFWVVEQEMNKLSNLNAVDRDR